ncbi:hypothetical protein [Streptomyces yaizuensis]|uniref:Helix-turn-helix domain-containing protein n=1 Tax=Streptomyces yaizuensis TaxID=2989713 RepID=A0ABQ5NY42_9ACTN|nr:hypothetical protein [Streptomyces sp. YSPA8]GLF95294.1 hypothetical protein SYYSPA8_13375 [Streptomyces sp. YSPA8]
MDIRASAARIRRDYDHALATADHDRARRLAQLSLEAGRGTQRDIIDGTGYSRETVRRLIRQGLELLPGPADETGQGGSTPHAHQLD